MRFVFRRSGALVGLYIGLVLAYGSLGYFKEVQIETIRRALTGLVAASGLLHFYYDGFIWKVRERATREHLGLAGGTSAETAGPLLPGWLLHGLKWVAVFVIPLGALWIGQARSTLAEVDREAMMAADLPNSTRALNKYGLALQEGHRQDEAAEQFQAALKLNPNADEVQSNLAHVLLAQSKFNEAGIHLEEAMRKDPGNGEFHSDYGIVLENTGRKTEGRAEHEKALVLMPKSGRVHYNYAMFLAHDGKVDEAITEFEASLRCKRTSSEAHFWLGRALFLKRDWEGAKTHYLETVRLDPAAPVHNSLGVVYMRLGDSAKAIEQFNEALRMHPDDKDAAENLRFALTNGAPGTSRPR